MIEWLINRGVNVNEVDSKGRTPLFGAANMGKNLHIQNFDVYKANRVFHSFCYHFSRQCKGRRIVIERWSISQCCGLKWRYAITYCGRKW